MQKLEHRVSLIGVLFPSRFNKLTMIPLKREFLYYVFLLLSA